MEKLRGKGGRLSYHTKFITEIMTIKGWEAVLWPRQWAKRLRPRHRDSRPGPWHQGSKATNTNRIHTEAVFHKLSQHITLVSANVVFQSMQMDIQYHTNNALKNVTLTALNMKPPQSLWHIFKSCTDCLPVRRSHSDYGPVTLVKADRWQQQYL